MAIVVVVVVVVLVVVVSVVHWTGSRMEVEPVCRLSPSCGGNSTLKAVLVKKHLATHAHLHIT